MLAGKFPRAAELMASAREDVLAFRHFPYSHWRKLWSTNLLERVNEEIKRRTRDVGIFPQRRRDHALGGGRADGTGRALAAERPPHVLARLDGRESGCSRRTTARSPSSHLVAASDHSARWRPGAGAEPCAISRALRDESLDRSLMTMQSE